MEKIKNPKGRNALSHALLGLREALGLNQIEDVLGNSECKSEQQQLSYRGRATELLVNSYRMNYGVMVYSIVRFFINRNTRRNCVLKIMNLMVQYLTMITIIICGNVLIMTTISSLMIEGKVASVLLCFGGMQFSLYSVMYFFMQPFNANSPRQIEQ